MFVFWVPIGINGGDRLNTSIYIPLIFLFIILYILYCNRRSVVARQTIQKRKAGGNIEMKELAKRFIDKECVISSFDGNHQYEGVIKEVTDGAILVEKNGKIEALNLDFVIRIREYPRKKNGKKKRALYMSLGTSATSAKNMPKKSKNAGFALKSAPTM